MRLYFIAICTVLILHNSATAISGRAYESILRESRIVRNLDRFDLSQVSLIVSNSDRFDLSQFPVSNDSAWYVSHVDPVAKSGWVIGVETDDAGKIVKGPPAGSQASIQMKGDFKNTIVLLGNQEPDGNYQWERPGIWNGSSIMLMPTPLGRDDEMERENDFYSPFIHGGTIVYKVHAGLQGKERFNPVYLIPDDWHDFVSPALEYYWKNTNLFDTRVSAGEENALAKNRVQLVTLLRNDNPFIAIQAAKTIRYTFGFDGSFVHEQLEQSTGFQQSVFTYLLLKEAANPKSREALTAFQRLETLVDNADNAALLKWVALGAYTAPGVVVKFSRIKPEDLSPIQKQSLILLEKIDKRQALIATKTAEDEYIDTLLKMAGLRKMR